MKKKVILSITLPLLFLLLILLLLHTPPVRSKVLAILLKNLEKQGISLRAEALDYNLLKFRFTLKKPVLQASANKEFPPFFKAEEVTVSIPLSFLWSKTLEFNDIKIQGAFVHVRVNADGTFNNPFKAESKSGASPPEFIIHRFHVPGASFIFEDMKEHVHIQVPVFHLDLIWFGSGKHRLQMAVDKKGHFRYRDQSLPLEQFKMDAVLDRQRMELNECFLHVGESGSSRFEIKGAINDYLSSPSPDMVLSGNGQLADFSPFFLPAHMNISLSRGDVDFRIRLKGSPKGIETELQSLRTAVELSAPGIQAAAKLQVSGDRLSGDFYAESQKIKELYPLLKHVFPNLYDTVANQLKINGHLAVNGNIRGKPTHPLLDARLKSNHLSLLNNALHFKLDGTLTSPVKFMDNRKSTIKLNLKDCIVQQRELGNIPLQAMLSKDRLEYRIAVPLLDMQGEGTLALAPPYPIKAGVKLDALSLKTLQRLVPLNLQEDVSGSITASITCKAHLDNLEKTAELDIDIERFQLKTAVYELVNREPIRLSYDPLGITVHRMALEGSGTVIAASGSLSLQSPSNRQLELSSHIDCGLFNTFFKPVNAQGHLSLQSRIGGSLLHPDISSEIKCSGGKLTIHPWQIPFDDIHLHLTTSGNTVFIESLSFKWGSGSYQLKGEVPLVIWDLERKPIDLLFSFQNVSQEVVNFLQLGAIPNDIKAAVSGRCEIKGRGVHPSQLSARIVLDTLDVNAKGITLLQEAPTEIRLENGKLLLNPTHLLSEGNSLRASGELDMGEKPSLNLSITGELDMKRLNSFFSEAAFNGRSTFNCRITGTPRAPELKGTIDIHDGGMRYMSGTLFLNHINGRINLDDQGLRLERLNGNFNGGTLEIIGLQQPGFKISLDKVNLNYPGGLRSEISGTLTFTFPGSGPGNEKYRLNGRLDLGGAVYREPFSLESKLYNYLRQRGSLSLDTEISMETDTEVGQPDFFNQLFFDIGLHTTEPLLVDNNIAKTEIFADLTLTGTPAHPVLAGRAHIKEGGEVYFGKNTFIIEQGTIDFLNPDFIEPDIKLTARTKVKDYAIRLSLSGLPQTFTASLTSTPPLSEVEIITLLVTGSPPGNISSVSFDTVGSQALLYLNASLTGRLEQMLKKTFGLENVRIDGSLAASKENPETRITIGQKITPNLQLTLSQGLRQTRNRTWLVDFNPITNINLQGTVKNDNQYSAALQHQLQFGLKKDQRDKPPLPFKKRKSVVRKIFIKGQTAVPKWVLRKKLKIKEGKSFDFFKYQEGMDRILALYIKNNYLNVNLEPKREAQEGNRYVDIYLDIDPGPQVFFDFRGAKIPAKLRKKIKRTWTEGQFEDQRLRDMLQFIHIYFLKRGYHQAVINALEPIRGEHVIRYILEINPGVKYASPRLQFQGNRFFSGKRLAALLKQNRFIPLVFIHPQRAAMLLEQFYKQEGFLCAQVSLPEFRFQPQLKKTTIDFSITENHRFRIGKITYEGDRFLEPRTLEQKTECREGDIYMPGKFSDAAYLIKAAYAAVGFNDVQVEAKKVIREKDGRVDLHFIIQKNQKGIIKEITIRGNIITKSRIIARELTFKKGDVVDARKIGRTRKNLYELGLFERVNIALVPMEFEPSSAVEDKNVKEKPFRVEITVEELKPWQVRYGLYYDTDTFLGIEGEVRNRNFLGSGHFLGTSFRVTAREQEARIFSRSPYFLKKKINTEGFAFIKRKEEAAFSEERTGITLQQQIKSGRFMLFSYGYTFERNHSLVDSWLEDGIQPPAASVEETTLHLGYVTAAVTFDSRDSLLNPGKGIFFSHSLQYGHRFLGSDVGFIRFFGQCSFYKKIYPFLVSASSLRIGLGKGLGQELVPGAKFYAGGGSTIRGFGYNQVEPAGGEALFIFNQELRFSLLNTLGTVLFMDVGNIYPEISDFDPFTVRKTLGVGLRFQVASLILRLDWGFKLDRRPEESASRIFFSMGQAF